jgi:hypothetical protein
MGATVMFGESARITAGSACQLERSPGWIRSIWLWDAAGEIIGSVYLRGPTAESLLLPGERAGEPTFQQVVAADPPVEDDGDEDDGDEDDESRAFRKSEAEIDHLIGLSI